MNEFTGKSEKNPCCFYEQAPPLPREIIKDYEFVKILSVSEASLILSLKKKLPHAEASFVLKRIPKKQYNHALYEMLFKKIKGNLLLPLQEYHTGHFVYLIFPQMQSLSSLVKCRDLTISDIKNLAKEIGSTLLLLHQADIYHFDVSPKNIYMDTGRHFYLADFSSAGFLKKRGKRYRPVTRRIKRTGSTPGFYPKDFQNLDISPSNYDVYGFCTIIYLLLNHGIPPDFSMLSYTKGKPEQTVKPLLRHLRQAIKDSETGILEKEFFSSFLHSLLTLFSDVKEQKTTIFQSIHPDDFENSLFCSFTEPVKSRHFNIKQLTKFKPVPGIGKQNHYKKSIFIKKSIPKSFSLFQKIKMPSLYGLLLFSGLVFLFLTYHIISTRKPEQQHTNLSRIEKEVQDKKNASKTASEKHAMSGGTAFEASGSSVLVLPPETPAISFSKTKGFLDISGQSLYDTSFLSKVSVPDQILILFAEDNDFSSCRSFFLFKNLKELYLHDNMISSVKGFSFFQNLEILDLSENDIEDISELTKMKQLKILDLSNQNHLKNLLGLKRIKSLKYLVITNTNVSKKEYLSLKKALPSCSVIY